MGRVSADEAPVSARRWRIIGPGLVAAATGVGSGDLVATMVAGANFGYALLWATVVGTLMKIVMVEGVGRYALASGETMFAGWRSIGRWTTWYFAPYIVIWGLVYGAAAMSASAMAPAAVFGGNLTYWAIGMGLAGFLLTWFGRYQVVEKIMAFFVGLMFVTVVGISTLTLGDLPEILRGLVPTVPEGSFVYVLGLAGGVGGTITLAAYGYWLREKGWASGRWMKVMRLDNAVAYVVTGMFVIAMLLLGANILYAANLAIASGDNGLLDMGRVLRDLHGPVIGYLFLIGFWAAAFSSVIGVWNGVSLMFADFVGHVRGLPTGHPDTRTGGKYFKWYVLWLTFPPMLLLFLEQPTGLVIAYGVLGSLFVPFLGVTLLILLNTRRTPERWRNGWLANTLLTLVLLAFTVLAVNELVNTITGA